MKRLVLCAAILALLSVTVMAKTYYIPHIHTANDSWETHLLLNNNSTIDIARCTVNLYDADGVLVMTFYPSIDPGETIDYSLRSYGGVTGTVDCPADFVSVRAGYVASESSGGGTAEFYLPDHLSNNAVLNLSGYYDQLTWSGYALFNGTNEDVTITPRYFTTDGLSHTGPSILLEAMKKRVDYFNNLLSHPFEDVTSVIFETDIDALAAIIISGKENEKLLFTGADETSESWEVVDRYTPVGMSAYLSLAGQATTSDYVLYALTSTVGFGFRNLVKCYDTENGELVWETEVDTEMDVRGISVSGTGEYVYVYGIEQDADTTRYSIYSLDIHTGNTGYSALFSHSGVFPHEENFKKQIHVASTGGTVLLVYQVPEGVCRVFFDEELYSTSPINMWADLDTVVTDVVTYDDNYYLIRTDWSETDEVYNVLNVYIFPYNNMFGGGLVQPLENLRFDGTVNHVFADGAYVKDNNLWLMLKVCIGNPYAGDMGYLNMSPADLVPAYFDLSDNSFVSYTVKHDLCSYMSSQVSSFTGPDNKLYMGVSSPQRSTILKPLGGGSWVYGYRFGNLNIQGDSLYMASWDGEYGDRTGIRLTHVVRVRKIPFTEFFRKHLQ